MYKTYDSYTGEESQFENKQDLIEFAKVYADRMNEENCEEEHIVVINSVDEAMIVLESAMIWVIEE